MGSTSASQLDYDVCRLDYNQYMTVYVDKSIHNYGRMIICHMIADNIDELHVMVDKIGVNRKWFQCDASTPHYDICKAKRSSAVSFGAVEVTRREMVGIIRGMRK